jgi:pimeloyl-ACP methyl ester carboxylesterase
VETPPFKDQSGRVLPNSLATMETVTIGGAPQRIWIRGRDRRNPPLILVHGGPGASESPLFRAYTPGLEDHFLVVYWDQRGAGRSYSNDIPRSTLKISQFVADLGELVDLVRSRFNAEKALIVGHSWGAAPGLLYAQDHPEKVLAFVGAAPIADMPRGELRSWSWALERARSERHGHAIAELTTIGPPPHDVEEMLISRKWVDRFGGSFHTDMDTGDLIRAALATSEATLYDLVLFGRGNRFSLEAIWPELRQTSLTHLTQFDTPIFFLLGRYDEQVPAVVAADYFATIEAPCKRLVWFENSGHNLPFEEPRRFEQVLTRELMPLVRSAECTQAGEASERASSSASAAPPRYVSERARLDRRRLTRRRRSASHVRRPARPSLDASEARGVMREVHL